MSKDLTSVVQVQNPQIQSRLQLPGRNWAEFDILSLLKPLQTFHEHWNSVHLLEYASKASRWLASRRTSTLEDLPTEILVEIFKHMGWRDVLASRQSCKRLREISNARPLWVFLFNRLSAELMAPPLLERPINTYTGDELEQIVLGRISSEIRWTSEQLPRTRSLPMDYDILKDATLLLEGGRWLLLKSPRQHSSRIYAYDLHKPLSQKPKCIIDLKTGKHPRVWLMAAAVDQNESDLTFNLCVVPSCYGNRSLDSPTESLGTVYIYRLTLDGCGSEATLKARKIKTLDKGLQAGSRIVSLQGRYLARCLRSFDPRYYCIEILDWVLSNSSVHSKSYIDLPTYDDIPRYMILFADGKLVTVTTTGVSLYNVADLRSVSADNHGRETTIQPYWTHSDSELYFRPHMSKPYSHLQTTRLAIAVKDGIYGLTVPLHSNEDPLYQPLSDIDISYTLWAALGVNKFYVNDNGSTGFARMGGFVWPDDDESSGVHSLVPAAHSRIWKFPDMWEAASLFDDRSNRLLSFTKGHWVIVDFSK